MPSLYDYGIGRFGKSGWPGYKRGPQPGYRRVPWHKTHGRTHTGTKYNNLSEQSLDEFYDRPPPLSNPGVIKNLPDTSTTIAFRRRYRRQWPTLGAARNDPDTFWMASNYAAELLGCTVQQLRTRYLLTGKLPYIERSWTGPPPNKVPRKRLFIPRPLVQELAVALVVAHGPKKLHAAKRKMVALKALDTIAQELNPETATKVVSKSPGVKPRFLLGNRQYTARRRAMEAALARLHNEDDSQL